MTFPDDENGNVLCDLQATGDRLDKPRDVDFNHIFPMEENAKQFSQTVHSLGYESASFKYWEKKKVWDVCVKIFMVPTHSDITATELKLDTLAREFLGRADGWGCMSVK